MSKAFVFLAVMTLACHADPLTAFSQSSKIAYKSFSYATARTPIAMTAPVLNKRELTDLVSELVGFEVTEALPSFVGGARARQLEGLDADPIQPVQDQDCETVNPQWFIYTLAGVFVAFGLVMNLAGWRVYQCMVFLIAGSLGWAFGYFITVYLSMLAGTQFANWLFWVAVGVGIVFGILFGILCVKFIPVAFFFTGAFGGMWLGLVCNWLCISYIENYALWIVWVWIGVLGLVCGAIAVCIGKSLIMLLTAWSGASLFVTGIAAFIENHDLSPHCNQNINTNSHIFWAYFAGMVVMAILGFIVQYKCFSDHEIEKYEKTGPNASV